MKILFQAESTLPPQPEFNAPDITKIRFRKPSGEFMERRFTVDTKLKVRKLKALLKETSYILPLQILLNFATANGFSPEEFKVISSFPRRDVRHLSLCNQQLLMSFLLQLTSIDPEETLKSLKLFPQETLMLEER